jgi:hypothetical protein
LILDNFRAHLHQEVTTLINDLNFDVKTLPPYTTPYLQPLDISVNKALKSQYSISWEAWMNKKSPEDRTKPSKDRIIEWTSKAWDSVQTSHIMNGWKDYVEYNEAMQLQGNILLLQELIFFCIKHEVGLNHLMMKPMMRIQKVLLRAQI